MQKFTLLLLPLLLIGCDHTKNSASYPSISASRPPGTACGPHDSATTTKRFPYYHPLGPTGGWAGRETLVDYQRTLDITADELVFYNGTIRGFMRFETEGSLRVLAYDDVYGNVYGDCSWAPEQLDVKPTQKPVYLKLRGCIIGDGGLATVHEVCWFTKGSPKGTIVFSSQHPPQKSQLVLSDIFNDSDIGGPGWFNYHGVVTVIREKLKKRELPAAGRLLAQAGKILAGLNPHYDLASKRSIPAAEHHALQLSSLMAIDLGLSLGSSEFNDKLLAFSQHAEQADRNQHCFLVCRRHHNLSKLYRWLAAALSARSQGQASPALPDRDDVEQGVVGSDPRQILAYLRGELTADQLTRYHNSAAYNFWIGLNQYLAGNSAGAELRLNQAIKKARVFSEDDGFELAAAVLLSQPGARVLPAPPE